MAAPPRVASLLPSTTEIVCALGARDRLVARSHECDHPPGVEALPALTSPRLDPSGASAAIHAAVKGVLREGLSVYTVDAAALRGLAPDVILTQTQCAVCAASPRDLEAALAGWPSPPRVVSLEPSRLEDVWGDVERVGAAVGRAAEGRAVAERLRGRVAAIAARAAGLGRPRVAFVEWIEPLMAAGSWTPELIALAGAEDVFGAAGEHARWREPAELAAADPDWVVVAPCGFDLARTRRELGPLAERPEWRGLAAVRAGRVVLADGNALFNRPGPRLVESLEVLAEALHPEVFAFGHEGALWERLAPATPEARRG